MDLRLVGTIALASIFASLTPIETPHQSGASDPFKTLQPEIVIDPADRQKLDSRQIVVKILPAKDQELAVLAAGSVNTTAGELARQVNDIGALKHSSLVPEIGRFSSPPTIADLASLTLDDVDLDAIGACRAGDCGLKLSGREIDELHHASDGSAGNAATAAAINREFRQIMLERVEGYLRQGLPGIPE